MNTSCTERQYESYTHTVHTNTIAHIPFAQSIYCFSREPRQRAVHKTKTHSCWVDFQRARRLCHSTCRKNRKKEQKKNTYFFSSLYRNLHKIFLKKSWSVSVWVQNVNVIVNATPYQFDFYFWTSISFANFSSRRCILSLSLLCLYFNSKVPTC